MEHPGAHTWSRRNLNQRIPLISTRAGAFLCDLLILYKWKRNVDSDILKKGKIVVDQNCIVKMSLFLDRWWDFNEVKDLETGEKTFKKDEQLFFVVVPLSISFPAELGMQSYY